MPRLFWPVMMKSILRDPFPMQWRGGLAVAVPKPKKAADELAGYRSVLLLEPSAKAVQKAYRPMIHEAFLDVRTPVHYGGVAKSPITLPSACAKAHLLHLDSTKSNGGAVFIDCAAAYYSVAREVLVATPEQCQDPGWAFERAAVFFDDEEDRKAFVEALQAHNLPDLLRERPELATLLRSQLADTWFSGRAEAHAAMRAESGTMPGSPVADLLFGLVFQRFLWKINGRLEKLGCSAFLGYRQPNEPAPSIPAWADDVCVLFEVSKATLLEPVLKEIMQTVDSGLRAQGLEANLGAGKTEAIVVAHGEGSQKVRRHLFAQDQPKVPFQTPKGPTHVRLVPSYTHLGCVLQAGCSDLPTLQFRAQQAFVAYGPIRRKLFFNPYLHVHEKLLILRSRVHSSFLHGAGLLVMRTVKERDFFAETVFKIYRGAFRPVVGISCKGFSNRL